MKWTDKIPARNVLIPWGLLALAILAGLLYLRFVRPLPPTYINVPGPTQYVPVPVKVAGEKVKVPVPYPVTTVERYPVEVVREKLKWPDLTDNTILTVGSVAPHAGKTSVVAVADFKDNTLSARLIMRQEPMSFFAIQKEFGVRAGMGTGGLVVGEMYARPARVGPVTVEIRGFAQRTDRSGADFGAVILADYRF